MSTTTIDSNSTGGAGRFDDDKKRIVIPLCDTHETVVAVTNPSYWQMLTKDSTISISKRGNYIPIELKSRCDDDTEVQLHLIIKTKNENENTKLESICSRIICDLILFKTDVAPKYKLDNKEVIVYGSLYNSLSLAVFNVYEYFKLHIKPIENALQCSISIEESAPHKYAFKIHNDQEYIMTIAIIQLEALIKKAQNEYLILYGAKIVNNVLSRTLIVSNKRKWTSDDENNQSTI